MALERTRRLLLRILVRVGYWPSLLAGRLMYALGLWRQWDAVDEHVLLGAIPVWGDLRRLRALGVTAVVNLCEEFPGQPARLAALGMTQLHLPTLDYHCPSLDDINTALDFIRRRLADRPGEKIYVHCKAGRGRSAAVALCYLMASRGLGAADAARLIRQIRPLVRRRLDRLDPVRRFELEFGRSGS
jgi:atypical dual specificity phosphatase